MLQLSHKREQPPTRWVDLWEQQNYHPFTGQSFGVVFLCFDALFAKHKNECQQCKYEHSKSHKVFEIKMIIVHKHHLHSMQNRGKPPCNTVVLVKYNINSRKIQLYILKVIKMKRTLLQRSFCAISRYAEIVLARISIGRPMFIEPIGEMTLIARRVGVSLLDCNKPAGDYIDKFY